MQGREATSNGVFTRLRLRSFKLLLEGFVSGSFSLLAVILFVVIGVIGPASGDSKLLLNIYKISITTYNNS